MRTVLLLLSLCVSAEAAPRVVELAGTPRAMGLAHGRALAAEGRALYAHYVEPLAEQLGGEAALVARAKALFPKLPPRFEAEMRGVAEGTGLRYEQVLLANTLMELVKLSKVGLKVAGCTVIGREIEGEPVVARNLDYYGAERLAGHDVVFRVRPEGRRPFLAVGFPLLVGVYSGMNDAGVGVAVLEVYGEEHQTPSRKAWPAGLLYRAVLEEAGDTRQGLALVGRHPIVTFHQLLLTDPRGTLVAELAQGSVRRAPGPAFAINNFQGHPGFRRDARSGLAEGTYRTVADLQRALRRAALGPGGRLNAQAILFFPRRRLLRVAVGPPPAAERAYHDFQVTAPSGGIRAGGGSP